MAGLYVYSISCSHWKYSLMMTPNWHCMACNSTMSNCRTEKRTGSCLTCLTCWNSTRFVCMYHHRWFHVVLLQVIIFVRTVPRCNALSQLLVEQNFPAICIHRGMPQEERYVCWLSWTYNDDLQCGVSTPMVNGSWLAIMATVVMYSPFHSTAHYLLPTIGVCSVLYIPSLPIVSSRPLLGS